MMPSVRDRVAGVLLGLAAGDRIGGPLRMALCLGESLLTQRAFVVEDIRTRYLAWWRTDGIDTGPVARRVFEYLDQGIAPEEAVALVDGERDGWTAGCNPAHRVAPLAMAAFLGDEQLARCARAEAALTHAHPVAGDTAAAVVFLCRALLRGADWEQALRCAAEGQNGVVRDVLGRVHVPPEDRGGHAPVVLHAALHFACTRPSFAATLNDARAFAGPANYAPVLAGALAGAHLGARVVLPLHLRHVGILDRVWSLAHALGQDWPDAPLAPARD